VEWTIQQSPMLDGKPRGTWQEIGQLAAAPDDDPRDAGAGRVRRAEQMPKVRDASAVAQIGSVDAKDHGMSRATIPDSFTGH
jgi:hypothetical protein